MKYEHVELHSSAMYSCFSNTMCCTNICLQNPFYTLTTPDIRQLTSQQFASDQQFSSTFPHQRHNNVTTSKLVPRALFQDQHISKSKSFSSKSRNKKHFQIPLQKCHSFKFQTAESYFQPIKNIHEENLMKNGYQSDYGPNYSRDCQTKRERHKTPSRHGPLILRRTSDTEKFRENLQFHENVQNSVQLQYPQPLYVHKGSANSTSALNHNGASNSIPRKNGVVYADLDMKAKSDKKRTEQDLKKLQKSRTEYATLKFNDVGQEIDV